MVKTPAVRGLSDKRGYMSRHRFNCEEMGRGWKVRCRLLIRGRRRRALEMEANAVIGLDVESFDLLSRIE
ncbi:MAG: hypothetical protein RMJ07_00825 [Nitrososphaerota archaeon]|nr:hypothetical protein [Nitrososphaerota archaeon]